MSSSLRVNTIVPSTGTNVAIGTANGTVTFTDSVNFVLGTGSSIFSPASNTLTFGTNDAERLRITSTGDVGINCTPHSNAGINLHIHGDNTTSEIRLTNTTTGTGANGSYIQQGGNTLYIGNSESGNTVFEVNGDERLRITSGGLVGVNCTPLSQFQVKSGTNQNIALSSMSSEASIEAFNDAGSANVPLRLRASVHKFFIGSTEGLRVHTNGLIGVGHDSPTAYGRMTVAMPSQSGGAAIQVANSSNGSGDGTTSNVVLRSVNNSANQWAGAEYRASDHIFAIQGTERLRIDSSGRLLLGTTTEGFATYGDKLTIADSGHCGMTIRSGTSSYGTIYFSDGDDGSADEVRGFIDYNHSNNQLQLGTDGATRLRIDSSGRRTLPNQPCAMAYNAQGQHMGGGSIAQFNSTRFNIGNMYNSSNGRMTVPVDGRYLVAYSGLHDYISQNAVGFDIRINGSTFDGGEGYQNRTGTPISSTQLSKTLILSLSANDYVDIYIRQSGTQVHQRYGSFSVTLLT